MKRLLAAGLFVIGLAVAGGFSGPVIADITTSTSSTTTATSTAATTTAVTTTTAVMTTTAPPATIPRGVRVAGVRVGGLTAADAVAAVQGAFARPLTVVVDRSKLVLDPRAYSSAYIPTAVAKARIAEPGTNVKLVVAVRGPHLRTWVDKVLRRFARPAVDARLVFRSDRPLITKDRVGRRLDRAGVTRRVVAALAANSRLPVRLHTVRVAPTSHRRVVQGRDRDQPVGEPPLPVRQREAAPHVRRRDRTGDLPDAPRDLPHRRQVEEPVVVPAHAGLLGEGLKPVPPGPDNPLGTRWMGLSVPGVGIHGTDAPSSIGYSLSHGCIRMQVPDAEWLFDHVEIGTTVHIV